MKGISSFRFTASGLELEEIEGSEEILEIDTLVFATGQKPELDESFGINLSGRSFAKVDNEMKTSIDGVFAAGDVVYGTKSVVDAIASGRQAAMKIDKYLGGDGDIEETLYNRTEKNPEIGKVEDFGNLKRIDCFNDKCDAGAESLRCLQCDLRLDIGRVKYWVDSQFKTVREVD